MTFNHDEIERNNIIEDYLLGRLSAEAESAFEEHMLFCDICREKCLQTEKIMEALKNTPAEVGAGTIPIQPSKRIRISGTLFRIAALFVLVAGSVVLFMVMKDHPRHLSENDVNMPDATQKDVNRKTGKENSIPAEHMQSETVKSSDLTEGETVSSSTGPEELLAAAYTPSPVFEQAVKNVLRGDEIQVISPDDSALFIAGASVPFHWQHVGQKLITLVVRKNTGEALFMEPVTPPFRYRISQPGLYYWQLIADDNVVYTGKFMVNK
ncbi:MAG: hypothetical protein JXR41_03900 [Bacteroidales bacterium]|nr:hypothetical protein [Bacteroidales bacterium]